MQTTIEMPRKVMNKQLPVARYTCRN